MLHSNIPLNLKFNITKGSEKRLINLRETPNESLDHIILKLLAYLVFFDENIQIEIGAFQHYKPDLIKFDEKETWKAVKWIDCGVISPKKLLKISKHNREAEIYIFKSNEESALSLKNKITNKKRNNPNIHYFVFNKEQINIIKQSLDNRSTIKIFKTAESNYLDLNFNNENLQLKYLRLC